MILIKKVLKKKIEDVDKRIPNIDDEQCRLIMILKKSSYNKEVADKDKVPNTSGLITETDFSLILA